MLTWFCSSKHTFWLGRKQIRNICQLPKASLAACGSSIGCRYLLYILKGPENVCLFVSACAQEDTYKVLPPVTKTGLSDISSLKCLLQPVTGRGESVSVSPPLTLLFWVGFVSGFRFSGTQRFLWWFWICMVLFNCLDIFGESRRICLLFVSPLLVRGKPHSFTHSIVGSNHLHSLSCLLLFIPENNAKSWFWIYGLSLKA